MNHPDCGQQVAAGQPLVVKNTERIESINIHGEDKRFEAVLYTYVFSRIVRRDFNLTSVKLFFFCKKASQRQVVRALLLNLTEEARVLADMAHRFEMPDAPVFSSSVMRIISEEAQEMLDALLTADRALHKLMHSPMADVTEENLVPFMRAYTALRQKVIGFPSRAPANHDSVESAA
jgi:hypothetical protein